MIDFLTKMGVPESYAGDIWLLLFFLIIGSIIPIVINKKSLGALVLSIYVAYVINSFAYFLPDNNNLKVIFFGVLIWLCYTGLSKTFNFSVKGTKVAVLFQTLFLSFLAVGMIAGLSLEWISSEELQIFFTPFSKKLLVSDAAKFIWTTLPFASLVFIKKHKR